MRENPDSAPPNRHSAHSSDPQQLRSWAPFFRSNPTRCRTCAAGIESASCRPTYFDLAHIEIELSALIGGRKVDLRTPAELSRYFRDQVQRESEDLYVAA